MKKMTGRTKWGMGFGIALLSLGLFWACSRQDKALPAPALRQVTVALVAEQQMGVPLVVAGRLAAETGIRLGFKLGGVIQTIAVNEGDKVRKGQFLAQLNQTEIQAQLNMALAAFDKAERDLVRVDGLYRDRAATEQQFLDVRTARQVALAQLDALKYNQQTTRLLAQDDGVILKRLAEPGEVVGPGMPVLYYASGDKRWVLRAGMSEGQILEVDRAALAKVRLSAYGERIFLGHVSEVAGGLTSASAAYEVEILLDAVDVPVLAGFVGRAEIEPKTKRTAYLVPLESLVDADGLQADLFVIELGKAQRKTVKIMHLFENVAAVQAGLGPELRVVVKGAAYLKAGEAVAIEGGSKGEKL